MIIIIIIIIIVNLFQSRVLTH